MSAANGNSKVALLTAQGILDGLTIALLVASVQGLAAPAEAQGGASCLFECGARCYGTTGPYCNSGCMAERNARGSSGGAVPASYGAVYATSDGSCDYGFSYGFHDQFSAMGEAKKR